MSRHLRFLCFGIERLYLFPSSGSKEKLELFKLLVEIGFKEIEIGFPSAAQTEFDFARKLIDEDLVPDDVALQVLTQAREHLIKRSFQSLKGAKKAIVHVYNSTSPLQRKVTFGMSREQIKQIAVDGVKLIRDLLPELDGTEVRLEYSPESFSDTEVDYALEVCEAVMEAWEPTEKNPIILNLPATVELFTPNVHADQIEWFCQNLKERNKAIISLHTHNDRGTGTAATELGLLAGANRVEGTLFGNGERTGNLVEGRSLVSLLRNPKAKWKDRYLFTQGARWKTGSEPTDHMWKRFAVRNERFRLVENSLYDMEKDPSQKTDIASEHPEVVKSMRAAYEKFWKETRPLMVNEKAPMSPTRPYHVLHAKQLKEGGIPAWKAPKL